jgi:citronellol/citronellal dehydrogenase
MARARTVDIVSDAAHVILTRSSREFTGNFALDDEILASAGITDLSAYSSVPSDQLLPDLFL